MEETQTIDAQEAPVQAPAAEVRVGTFDGPPLRGTSPELMPEHVRDALMASHPAMRAAMNARVDRAYRAFRRGSAANFGKFSRTSTEYGDPEADAFWFAGYDGKSWEEAVREIIV